MYHSSWELKTCNQEIHGIKMSPEKGKSNQDSGRNLEFLVRIEENSTYALLPTHRAAKLVADDHFRANKAIKKAE